MSFTALLKNTARIRTKGANDPVANPYGKPSFTTGSAFACRFEKRGRVVVGQDAENVVVDGTVFIPPTITVTDKDEIEIDSVVYEIVSLNRVDGAGALHHYEASVRRKDPAL